MREEEEGGGGIFKDGEERIGKEKVVLGKIRCHGGKKKGLIKICLFAFQRFYRPNRATFHLVQE